MYKTKYILLSLIIGLLITAPIKIFSQATTKVSGKVVDAQTREPLPFVNIIFKGTTVGVTTDVEGFYSMSTTLKVDSIELSYVGYNRTKRAIKPGVTQELNIPLSQGVELKAVTVVAGENPAWRILRKIIANKPKNDRKELESYDYELYNKVEFDLNNINKATRKVLKPFSFIFDGIDSSNTKEKPYLPVFMTEALSDFHYRKSPPTKNEVIKASKVAGVQNATVSQFMGDMYQNVNIYDNAILVFGKNFMSPIADNALAYYKYYLIDSMTIGGHKCYQLQFKPKRKQELTFSGNLWTADTTFGIIRLEMAIADDANINFINTTNVVQEYTYVDSTWMMKRERLVIDFNPNPLGTKGKSQMGVYGRKTASYSNFKINKPHDSKFYSIENLKVNDDAFSKSDDYWKQHRLDTLTKDEKQIYHMVDTLQSLPIYNTWVNVIQMFYTGYKVHGNFEYGPYYNMFSTNEIEGNRFRFGGRTSNKFSKWYEFNGYCAYGTKDERFKYQVGMRAFLSKKPRILFEMYHKDDYEILGESPNGFTQDNVLNSALAITPLNNLTDVKETRAFVNREWFTGFTTQVGVYNRVMTPLANFHYEYQKTSNTVATLEHITTTEVQVLVRMAYGEKYVEGVFTRTAMNTPKWPILSVTYVKGIKDVFGGDYNYNKLIVNVDHRLRTNGFGYIDYVLEYGKIWDPLPYPLLTLHGGNETYTYDPYAFNAMNYYEFVSDEYASVRAQYHLDGFFFNKIPLLRKLKWREVVGANAIVGSVRDENRSMLNFPDHLYDLSKGPYLEASTGIENIFKVFRLDGVYRLSYLDNPRVTPFSVRFSIQLMF